VPLHQGFVELKCFPTVWRLPPRGMYRFRCVNPHIPDPVLLPVNQNINGVPINNVRNGLFSGYHVREGGDPLYGKNLSLAGRHTSTNKNNHQEQ
jgi:hypothetical protein